MRTGVTCGSLPHHSSPIFLGMIIQHIHTVLYTNIHKYISKVISIHISNIHRYVNIPVPYAHADRTCRAGADGACGILFQTEHPRIVSKQSFRKCLFRTSSYYTEKKGGFFIPKILRGDECNLPVVHETITISLEKKSLCACRYEIILDRFTMGAFAGSLVGCLSDERPILHSNNGSSILLETGVPR